jgi:cell division initiation protein
MDLTPEEIVSYDLKQSVRGYSVAQVDELLDRLADQVEAAQQQQERLTARLHEAEQRLEATQETESTLKRTLITAQQAAERSLQEAKDEAEAMLDRARQEAAEVEQDARQEAERVLADARASASREAEEARRRRAALQERVDELAERERRHRAHLRELLEHQLAELERMGPLEDDLASAVGDEENWTSPGVEDTGEAEEATAEREEASPWPVEPTEADRPARGQGLRVRMHDRAGGSGGDSPLGSAHPPGEE